MPRGPDFFTRDKVGEGSLTIMVGLSRSGKSTWVNGIENSLRVIISSDDMRRALGHEWNPHLEPMVQAHVYYAATAQLVRGVNVLIDSTNLTRASRKRWIDLARRMKVAVHIVEIKQPYSSPDHKAIVEEDNFPWKVVMKQMFDYESFRPDECDGLEYTHRYVPNVVDQQKETSNLSTD